MNKIKKIFICLISCIMALQLVACNLSDDDIDTLINLVNDIADEYGSDTSSSSASTSTSVSKETKTSTSASVSTSTKASVSSTSSSEKNDKEYVTYSFRSKSLRDQHYDKHGKDMGFKTVEDYVNAANDVINNPDALHKTEKEDGDYVYYVEATNDFVIVSKDGYIRTYFRPDAGISYYNRQ